MNMRMFTILISVAMFAAHPVGALIANGFQTSLRLQMLSSASIEDFSVCLNRNPQGLRIFHSFFPAETLNPISMEEASGIMKVRQLTGVDSDNEGTPVVDPQLEKLPWVPFPMIGIRKTQNSLAKSQIQDCYERNRHHGQFIWAYPISHPKKGCLLLNHWEQRVVLITDYSTQQGAEGIDLLKKLSHPSVMKEDDALSWPPLALEMEMKDNTWQAVMVSDNILNGDIFKQLPVQMSKALWELIFLLLVSEKSEPQVMKALFDTGLSPKNGFISYCRLLQKVMERAEGYEEIPGYRQILETELKL